MIENIIAWGLLIVGMFSDDSQMLMAAGLFAIACNLNRMVDFMRKKVSDD